MKDDKFTQEGIIPVDVKSLEDFFEIRGNTLKFKGASLETMNFITGKRGVQIRNEGLNASGGTIQGSTISGGTSSTTITGDLTHTGSKVGLNGVTPVSRASAIGQLTNSTGGSADATVAAVGNTSSSDQSTVINNNFSDLIAKVNALETAMKNIGISS